jgi:putative sigma-54 modulation protein
MQIIVKGKNLEIPDSLKNYAEEKVKKLTKYFDTIKEIQIEFSLEKSPNTEKNKKVEVIIKAPKKTIMAEEISFDMYASIDEVLEKLERQLKKHKEKLRKHLDKSVLRKTRLEKIKESKEILISEEEREFPEIVKVKNFLLKPMDPEEAINQMELLGHTFFVFLNSETDTINVVYKRKDGKYGLIQPEI